MQQMPEEGRLFQMVDRNWKVSSIEMEELFSFMFREILMEENEFFGVSSH